ncbi:transmembrane protein 234 homolog isoform X1 [Helicoverpa armigera]|uniref:transmembrane protein 234 homolog isoform X1 n=1 Tax=Helicoverpa armigera TaxID=29058 RepID=UPI0030835D27
MMLEAIGLLVLTGVLWGCTNPFIRQGTKGLRDVTATTLIGQVWAEVSFLLGNWKYVVPWLVNQAGSLSYLAAVQRAPLSVAVPTANSLAFVFTAVTGAGIGAEEPLDRKSILGIVLIMAGTALCCIDDTS